MHDGADTQNGGRDQRRSMGDAFMSCGQDPKMFRAVQMVYFVTPVIGGVWIMNQVRVSSFD